MPPWSQDALDRLAGAGLRRGGARSAVIEVLEAQSCAVSAFELEDLLRRRESGRGASRASIYRVLDELVEHRLATRVDLGQGIVRFEPLREDGHHHHHLVCDDCGDVAPFHDDDLERAIDRAAERVALDVAEHEITLRGRCAQCR